MSIIDQLFNEWSGTIMNTSGDMTPRRATLRFTETRVDGAKYIFEEYTNIDAGYTPHTHVAQIVERNSVEELHFYDGTGIWRIYRADTESQFVLKGDIINRSGVQTATVNFVRRKA
jgi:hypothetical protein